MTAPTSRSVPDALLPGAFVTAAAVEALWRDWGRPTWLVVAVLGSGVLALLALRRSHPLLAMSTFCAASIVATSVQARLPDPTSRTTKAFVPIIALLVFSYALAAYGGRRSIVLGAPQPVVLVAVVDLLQPEAGSVGGALPFVALIVVAAPMTAGWLVRSRARLLDDLHRTEAALADEHRSRLRTTRAEASVAVWDGLATELGSGLAEIDRLLSGPVSAADAATVEATARALLARTRRTVVDLAGSGAAADQEPADPGPVPSPPAAPDPAPRLGDGPMTWSALVASAAGLTAVLQTQHRWSSAVLALALAALMTAALALTWRWPLPALTAGWVAAVAFDREAARLTADQVLTVPLLLIATPFLAGWLLHRRPALVGLVIALVAGLACNRLADAGGVVVLSCAGWCGGRLLRGRAVLVERVRLAHGQLRAQRAAELRTTVLEQRAALARDVHDDVGHSLTVLALQAGAARRLAVRDPAASAAALAVVADVARRARARLTAEQDGPQDLGALVEQARRLGTTVTVEGDLERTPAVPAAARVLHRVLQECLTNVMRHAPGAAVTITFSAAADGFVLAVRNSAPLESSGLRGAGTGLDGMRARLADAGGTLESGPMPDGGFRVVARLPHLGAKELVG